MARWPEEPGRALTKRVLPGIRWSKSVLQHLGIWDAEVQEGQLQPGVNDDGTCGDDWLDMGSGAYYMSDLMKGVEYGQTVRVIVLPKEE